VGGGWVGRKRIGNAEFAACEREFVVREWEFFGDKRDG
jgi:hypothetical protein